MIKETDEKCKEALKEGVFLLYHTGNALMSNDFFQNLFLYPSPYRAPDFLCSLWIHPLTVNIFRVIMEHEMITAHRYLLKNILMLNDFFKISSKTYF